MSGEEEEELLDLSPRRWRCSAEDTSWSEQPHGLETLLLSKTRSARGFSEVRPSGWNGKFEIPVNWDIYLYTTCLIAAYIMVLVWGKQGRVEGEGKGLEL